MAFRTDQGLVEGVLGNDYNSDNNPSLTPYMRTGNILANRMVACAAKKGIAIGSDTLIEIETQLSAHFYVISDQKAEQEKTDDAMIRYQGKTDMGLNYSPYGQTAMLLDPSGCLQSFSSSRRISIDWVGKEPSNKIDWVDRL